MPSKTKSHLAAENALRARLPELEDRLANLPGGETEISGKPGEGTLLRVTIPVGNEATSNA